MALPVVIDSTSKVDTTNKTSRQIKAPTNQSGDFIFISVSLMAGGSISVTGFSVLLSTTAGSATVAVFYKLAGSPEPANYTITNSVSGRMGSIAISVRGAQGIHVQGSNQTGSGVTVTAPGFITTLAECLRLSFSLTANFTTPHTAFTDHTHLVEEGRSGSGSVSAHSKNLNNATTESAATLTSNVSANWVGVSFALSPTYIAISVATVPLSGASPTLVLGSVPTTDMVSLTTLTSALGEVKLGPITVVPVVPLLTLTGYDPSVVLGSISINPEVGVIYVSDTSPETLYGSTESTPDPIILVLGGTPREVILGGVEVSIFPVLTRVTASIGGVVVVLGSIILTPMTSDISLLGVSPTVQFGSLQYTPTTPGAVTSTVSPPSVILGSITVSGVTALNLSADVANIVEGGGSVSINPTPAQLALSTTYVALDLTVTPSVAGLIFSSGVGSIDSTALLQLIGRTNLAQLSGRDFLLHLQERDIRDTLNKERSFLLLGG